MFLVRNVLKKDLNDLYELSQQALLLNLPQNKEVIARKITESIQSFEVPDTKDLSKNHFIFVLEDTSKQKVIGVSMIHGKHGTKEKPHLYLRSGTEERASKTLNKNFSYKTLKFGYETDGYSEIGGLILHSDFRGHPKKLGKLLSMSRFLFIKKNHDLFTEEIHSELMPPLTPEGTSHLWEAIGRKFFKMEYWEADELSRTNKEFIFNLFPQGTIYTELLPKNAVNTIGKVGQDTKPVRKMLENIGFKFTHEVDPFDGGPHYRAKVNEISVCEKSYEPKIIFKNETSINNSLCAFFNNKGFQFICTYGEEASDGSIYIEKDFKNTINEKNACAFSLGRK